jgi:hypothetical protein
VLQTNVIRRWHLLIFKLRNKSWKPEYGWRILVFYPEPEARIKFTNIRQPMLKLKTHSDFHDLFRF